MHRESCDKPYPRSSRGTGTPTPRARSTATARPCGCRGRRESAPAPSAYEHRRARRHTRRRSWHFPRQRVRREPYFAVANLDGVGPQRLAAWRGYGPAGAHVEGAEMQPAFDDAAVEAALVDQRGVAVRAAVVSRVHVT